MFNNGITKVLMLLFSGNSKLLPSFQISHLQRDKKTEWVPASEKFDSMKLKLLGVNFIAEDLQSTYSERAIDSMKIFLFF